MAAAFVALHVAANAEGFAASGVGALEGLLPSVGMTVNAQRAWARKGLVAGLADVAVLGLRERGCRRRRNVVVVLPRVSTRGWHGYTERHGREGLK